MLGQTISHYKIIEKLGAGGMGEVYLADDKKLKRKVALKFLPERFISDPDLKARFNREAQATAALNHPNIATIHAIEEIDDKMFIVMEYIAGESLKDLISKGSISIDKALEIIIQICQGLSKAHGAGVVHRDIKPANILIDNDGKVKIVDFGLAKLEGVTQLTEKGATMGTPIYMSPEQIKGQNIDHRTDIFSVGVVFYELLSGKVPFDAEELDAIYYSILKKNPKPLSKHISGPTKELQLIIDKALEKNPPKRYPNINTLLQDVRNQVKIRPRLSPTVTFKKLKTWSIKPTKYRVITALSSLVLLLIISIILAPKFLQNRESNLSSTKKADLGESESPNQITPLRKEDSVRTKSPIIDIGRLRITSVPSGANIWLNGKLVGGTPFEDNEIKGGDYDLLARLQGYQDFKQRLTVRQGELTTLLANLKSLSGTIEVTSEPSGATILLDGQEVGTTPTKIQKVKPGTREIVLQKTGFANFTTSVKVESGKVRNVNGRLSALVGQLQVLVRPYGSIFIDGELKQTNAISQFMESLNVGQHTVKVVHPDLGTWEKTIEIELDKPEDISIDFNKFAKVTVLCGDPTGRIVSAEIFVDSKSIGKSTPKETPLRIGKHTIEVRRDGFALVGDPVVINLEEGMQQTLQFTLKKAQ